MYVYVHVCVYTWPELTTVFYMAMQAPPNRGSREYNMMIKL